MSKSPEIAEDSADVLVIGGGPAGAWAAINAALAGSRVILVDKGYFGTSGATAPSNTGTWCVPPAQREAEILRRGKLTGSLSKPEVVEQMLDGAYRGLHQLVEWGYLFPKDDEGKPYIADLRGPDYMRFMRQKARALGVIIMDHCPALTLLQDAEGIAGAVGIDRQRHFFWRITASSVVLATGGCAFGARILGTTGLTGDGYLMGAQAGAALSGMEYSAQYGIAPVTTSMNKGLIYQWATFYDAAGQALDIAGDRQVGIAKALAHGPVYACLDKADSQLQQYLRQGQPNCFVPFDRQGINPFSQHFAVTLRCEGTVRGLGGLQTDTFNGSTAVNGLYAVGDAASREAVNGVISGGGGPNASWAIASGRSAGVAAASFASKLAPLAAARAQKQRNIPLYNLGGIGYDLQGDKQDSGLTAEQVFQVIQNEMLPLEKNFFRTEAGLSSSLSKLYQVYKQLSHSGYQRNASLLELLRRREARAMLSVARWSYKAALLRQESRGIHRRLDQPQQNPQFSQRIIQHAIGQPGWEQHL